MLRGYIIVAAFGFLAVGTVRPSSAQQATVQQPVIQTFTASTTISVPDRGGAYIGGVKSFSEGRRSSGVFGPGGGIGRESAAAGMSAHVYIHDFEEMDRRLLGRAASGSSAARLAPPADDAWQSLMARYRHAPADARTARSRRNLTQEAGGISTVATTGRNAPVGPPPGSSARLHTRSAPSPSANQTRGAKAALSYSLGLKAEREGKTGVARLHFRMAAKYGSEGARAKLNDESNVEVAVGGGAP